MARFGLRQGRFRWRPRRLVVTAILCAAACACDPTVVIGTRACSESSADASTAIAPDAAVGSWTTGFEDGFCDYVATGFCLSTGTSSYTLVTAPVHSGKYAAAYTVLGVPDGGGSQARCAEQGVFPSAAYYGAWYYVPAPATNDHLWNLWHFQGGVPGQALHGLWDVSLLNASGDGSLHAILYDFLTNGTSTASAPIPIGQWFHLEVYFRRAKDATGELTMWQDSVMMVQLTGLVTDDTDWGQWYVGNLADDLVPPSSTIYVDDVTIGSSL